MPLPSQSFVAINSANSTDVEISTKHNQQIFSITPVSFNDKLSLMIPATLIVGTAFIANYAFKLRFSQKEFSKTFALVLSSELGDKTFFASAMLVAKYGALWTYSASLCALGCMSLISTLFGMCLKSPSTRIQLWQIPTDVAFAILAFTLFGLKSIYDAVNIAPAEINRPPGESSHYSPLALVLPPSMTISTYLKIAYIVFAAEIGDKSSLSTIAMAASTEPLGVFLGATAAHAVCSMLAVVGGTLLVNFVSERVLGLVSGILFLVMALNLGWKEWKSR